MLVFLQNNIANILIVLALAAVVFLIVLSMHKNKRRVKPPAAVGVQAARWRANATAQKNNLNNQYLYDMP